MICIGNLSVSGGFIIALVLPHIQLVMEILQSQHNNCRVSKTFPINLKVFALSFHSLCTIFVGRLITDIFKPGFMMATTSDSTFRVS